MRNRFSPVLVLALALSLLTAPAQAAPQGQTESPRLLSRLVTLVKSLPGRLVSVWEKEGSIIDPFGGNGTTSPVPGDGSGALADNSGDSQDK